MDAARIIIVIVGVLVPYLARIVFPYIMPEILVSQRFPGLVHTPAQWLKQYTDTGLAGHLFLSALNLIPIAALVLLSFDYKSPWSLLIPSVLGLGFLAHEHGTLDLASSSTASLGLLFIPIWALLPILIGAVIGYAVDKWLIRRRATQ